jgi:hypothetical protein
MREAVVRRGGGLLAPACAGEDGEAKSVGCPARDGRATKCCGMAAHQASAHLLVTVVLLAHRTLSPGV